MAAKKMDLTRRWLRWLAAPLLALLALLLLASVALAQEGGLVAPAPGQAVKGMVTVRGYADHTEFRKWQLDLLTDGNADQAHFLALGETPLPTAQVLTVFDTRGFADGEHLLRLRVVHTNLNYEEIFSPVTIRNHGGGGSALVGVLSAAAQTSATATAVATILPSPEPTPTPTPLATPAPIIRTDVPDGERWIAVDLSDQRLTAYQGDLPVFETMVSTGKTGWRTLPGTFAVYLKYRETRMRGDDYDTPDVPWTMYYSGDFAIHGAYWHDNFGTPVSHGCVNLRVDEAEALYAWAPMGARVVVNE
ncbi:MAG: L,D-transpeptidase [Caldilineaceae bacterium]